MRARARTLYQQVLDETAELARTGQPDPTPWTCGGCGRGHGDGVRMYYTKTVLREDRGRQLLDFVGTLICPYCSFISKAGMTA